MPRHCPVNWTAAIADCLWNVEECPTWVSAVVQSVLPLHSERECKQTIGTKESFILFLETFPVCLVQVAPGRSLHRTFHGQLRLLVEVFDSCVLGRSRDVFLTTGRGGRMQLNKGGSYPMKSYLLCDIGATTFYSSSLCSGSLRLVTSSILDKYYSYKWHILNIYTLSQLSLLCKRRQMGHHWMLETGHVWQ